MELVVAARTARRAGFALALVCLTLGFGAARASAVPGIGRALRAPVAGLHVDLACSNPANHGLVGQVLGAVATKAGGPMRCFSQAIAHGKGLGPQIMAGPTGLGPKQIQSAYKLSGLSSARADGRDRRRVR